MGWPTPQDYNEAIQNPQSSFIDDALRNGQPVLNALGIPQPSSGNFASVYRMKCQDKDWAVRCFLRPVTDQAVRYQKLSDFIVNDDLSYTVDFHYLQKGINVHGEWYPILKMEWVDGITLDQYIKQCWNDSGKIDQLAENFKTMVIDLYNAGVAHGDLQHGNIMLVGSELRLVDYDDFFIPALAGFKSNAIGHRNYQHPARTENDFDSYIDNFSSWVIYSSLKALSIDADLSVRLSDWDDCMLFKHQDYLSTLRSRTFGYCGKHRAAEVRSLTESVKANLSRPLPEIPALSAGASITMASPFPVSIPDDRYMSTSEYLKEVESIALELSPLNFQRQKSGGESLRIRAKFAESEIDIVEAEPDVVPFTSADQDDEKIAEIVRNKLSTSEFHFYGLCDGTLDLQSYAETVAIEIEPLVGRRAADEILAILTRLKMSIAPQSSSRGSVHLSAIRRFVGQKLALEEGWDFSSRYLAELYSKEKRILRAKAFLLTLIGLMVSLPFVPFYLEPFAIFMNLPFLICVLVLAYQCGPLINMKGRFRRYPLLLKTSEPCQSAIRVTKQAFRRGFELEVVSLRGRTGVWQIRNEMFATLLPDLMDGKVHDCEVYFDPLDGRPFAIFSGSDIIWLD